jgi:hypothetical protein
MNQETSILYQSPLTPPQVSQDWNDDPRSLTFPELTTQPTDIVDLLVYNGPARNTDGSTEVVEDDYRTSDRRSFVWYAIELSIGNLTLSKDPTTTLEEMTRISCAVFLHLASEESTVYGQAYWRDVYQDIHLHIMFRSITAYRYLNFILAPDRSATNAADMELARKACIKKAEKHWHAASFTFLERHQDLMRCTIGKELDLQRWSTIERNCAMLQPEELAMIDAALLQYNHARVRLSLRSQAQKQYGCPKQLGKRTDRMNEIVSESPDVRAYLQEKSYPDYLKQRIDNFLEKGHCIYCGRCH